MPRFRRASGIDDRPSYHAAQWHLDAALAPIDLTAAGQELGLNGTATAACGRPFLISGCDDHVETWKPAVHAVSRSPQTDTSSTQGRRSRPQLAVVGLLLLVGAAIVLHGARTTPADPVVPLELEGTDALQNLEAAPTLRVATFNIHAGVGEDGVRDLGRTAASLVDVDVAALQEVCSPLLSTHAPQVAEIAGKLQMAWLFAPAERHWWHDDYGTALLARTPLTSCIRVPLPTSSRRRFRAAILATFPYQGQTVHLLAAHIDRDAQDNTHEHQLRAVADLFLSLAEPAILVGDLNDIPSHPEIRRMLEAPGVVNALAGVPPSQTKKAPLDWIITRGFRAIRSEWRESTASDHPAGWAELQLAAGSGSTRKPAERTAELMH